MPNWCECELIVIADEEYDEELSRFVEQVKCNDGDDPTDLSLNATVPMPAELEHTQSGSGDGTNQELIEKYGTDNWYDWHVQNWGIKWDIVADGDYDGCTARYTFDAPWGPPIEWMRRTSELFPHLEFSMKYDEPGMGFMGVATSHNGELADKCMEY